MRIQTKLLVGLFLICSTVFAEFGGGGAMMGAAGVASTVGLSSPTYRAITQRNSGSCAVKIAGTYTGIGTATAVKAKADVVNGGSAVGITTVDGSPVANAFTGTLTVSSGWYSITVEAFNGASVIGQVTVAKVGCGDIYLIVGQSLSANNNQTQTSASDDRVEMIGVPITWQRAIDPFPLASGAAGSVWNLMGDLMVAHTNAPVAFLDLAQGGSVICTTAQPSWKLAASPTLYDSLKTAAQLFPENGFKAVLIGHGETDTANGCANATFAAGWEADINQLRTDIAWTAPVVMALETAPGNTGATLVRGGEAQFVTDMTAAFTGPDIDLIPLVERFDGTHLNITGQTNSATRWYNAVVSAFGL